LSNDFQTGNMTYVAITTNQRALTH